MRREINAPSTESSYSVMDRATADWGFQYSRAKEPVSEEETSGVEKALSQSLTELASLVANITEAYTTAIFVADPSSKVLDIGGVHTLSREFHWETRIGFGSGLVGWTAENGLRVSVSPFEHDATTLLYYQADQGLKSFIAVPILRKDNSVIGVIACDSKKNYAFAKVTEKILEDCAKQAATTIELYRALGRAGQKRIIDPSDVSRLLEALREVGDEDTLLQTAANIPSDMIERDALVVMTTNESGIGRGRYYSAGGRNRMEHRLLEVVCKHKKIICGERSVQARPTDDMEQRSFLSIPFRVLGQEAGSFNLLSHPHESFDGGEVAVLEEMAKTVGQELERIRLRDRMLNTRETSGVLSWKHFSIQSGLRISESKKTNAPLSLVRISVNNLSRVENLAGVEIVTHLMQKLMRLVDQTKPQAALSSYLYGFQILVLVDSSELGSFVTRLQNLIGRISAADIISTRVESGRKLGEMILDGTHIVSAEFPSDGAGLQELIAKTHQLLEVAEQGAHLNFAEEVRNWG